MKIVNSYLMTFIIPNGPSSFEKIYKVVELENGSFYKEDAGGKGVSYEKFIPTETELKTLKG